MKQIQDEHIFPIELSEADKYMDGMQRDAAKRMAIEMLENGLIKFETDDSYPSDFRTPSFRLRAQSFCLPPDAFELLNKSLSQLYAMRGKCDDRTELLWQNVKSLMR